MSKGNRGQGKALLQTQTAGKRHIKNIGSNSINWRVSVTSATAFSQGKIPAGRAIAQSEFLVNHHINGDY